MISAKPKFTITDLVLGALIVAIGFYIFHKISVGLSYKWNWEAIPQFFFRYDSATNSWMPNILVEGFLTTIRLSVWATVFATFIGIVMGLFRVSQSLFKRLLGGTYVELVRNLPPLAGQFISTIKDSAIVSVISIQELTFQGMELMSTTYFTFEIWITITVMYLILTLTCSLAVAKIEIYVRKSIA